jgi:hypothetical protein
MTDRDIIETTSHATISSAENRHAPEWSMRPFEEFLSQTERLGELLDLSMRGISLLRGVPRIVEVIAKVKSDLDDPKTKGNLDRARREADLAQKEVDQGFPLLRAQAAIALWAALEACVRLFVVRWLQNHKPAMEVDAIQKLRVKIGEYERLDGEDRFFYILDRLEQELSTPLRSGVIKFEAILEPFGLSGTVHQRLRRDIFELNQIRNALVHRAGIADRRLIDACPWLGLTVGDQVKIDVHTSRRYFGAVVTYATELICRVGEYFEVDMRAFRERDKERSGESEPAGQDS